MQENRRTQVSWVRDVQSEEDDGNGEVIRKKIEGVTDLFEAKLEKAYSRKKNVLEGVREC